MPPYGSLLVTGASGAFGSAFVPHVLRANLFDRVCLFSRSESRQADLKRTITDSRCRWFIGDVRDRARLTRAFHDVQVVVHAAALKRIEVCEYDAMECAKTNVLGTMNVLEAATDACVEKVVTLSSDKGSAPLGTYGASKLLAERLTLAAEQSRGTTGPHFSATRYGNVANSTGSIIPIWRQSADPVLSDPTVTRFWMTLPEAVALVLWTIQHMRGGELVVPTLPAYRLGDLAVAMGIQPRRTTLGMYEKLHETMIASDECRAFRQVDGRCIAGGGWTGPTLLEPLSSDTAPQLGIPELRTRLAAL